jgi:hypothetical protein
MADILTFVLTLMAMAMMSMAIQVGYTGHSTSLSTVTRQHVVTESRIVGGLPKAAESPNVMESLNVTESRNEIQPCSVVTL